MMKQTLNYFFLKFKMCLILQTNITSLPVAYLGMVTCWNNFSIHWLLNFMGTRAPGGLVETQIARPHPRLASSSGLQQHLTICISSHIPGDADAAGPGTPL